MPRSADAPRLAERRLRILGVPARLARGLRAAWMLRRTLQPAIHINDPAAQPAGSVRVTTPAGAAYDRYDPARRPRRAVVLVAGLTASGERDFRLVELARALQSDGFLAAAVSLPGLKACRDDPADLAAITEVGRSLREELGRPVALVGFSFGGGYALAAAAREPAAGAPEAVTAAGAPWYDVVLTFGAHHRLERLWRGALARFAALGGAGPEPDEDAVYRHLVLARRVAERLDLTPADAAELEERLAEFCRAPRVAEAAAFARRALPLEAVVQANQATLEPPLLAALSPAGRLHGVRGRVVVVHDRSDALVPPAEAAAIHAELAARGDPAGQALLVTPLLSHVTARDLWRVHDLCRLLGAFGELYRAHVS